MSSKDNNEGCAIFMALVFVLFIIAIIIKYIVIIITTIVIIALLVGFYIVCAKIRPILQEVIKPRVETPRFRNIKRMVFNIIPYVGWEKEIARRLEQNGGLWIHDPDKPYSDSYPNAGSWCNIITWPLHHFIALCNMTIGWVLIFSAKTMLLWSPLTGIIIIYMVYQKYNS